MAKNDEETLDLDLDDSLNEAFEELTGESDGGEESAAAESDEKAEDSGEAEEGLEESESEPEASASEAGDDSGESEAEDAPGGESESAEEIDPSLSVPPNTWRAGAKAKWDSIDPEIRQEILKREEDGIKGVQAVREKADAFDSLNSIISPYEPLLRATRQTAGQAITSALDLAHRLASSDPKGKAQVILELAQQSGADLESLKGAEIQQPNPLQNEVRQLRSMIQSQQTQAQQAQAAQTDSVINNFIDEVGDDGKPLRPFYSNVEPDMPAFITAVKRENPNLSPREVLEQAYDRAIWANPETRQILEANKVSQINAERQKRQAETKRKARKANASNVRGKPAIDPAEAKPVGTIDDDLNDLYDEIQSRN